MMFFDLATVFDDNVTETLARQTGWTNNEEKSTREYWLMCMAGKNVGVKAELVRDAVQHSTKSTLRFSSSEPEKNSRVFHIPLVLARDEFKQKMMQLCGYNEDRYNSDVMSYIVDCQLKDLDTTADQITVAIPLWTETDETAEQ